MIQLVLFIYGLVVLVSGKWPVGGGKELVGDRARICGGFLMAAMPLAFLGGVVTEMLRLDTAKEPFGVGVPYLLEAGLFIACTIAAIVMGKKLYKVQEEEFTRLFAEDAAKQEAHEKSNFRVPPKLPNG